MGWVADVFFIRSGMVTSDNRSSTASHQTRVGPEPLEENREERVS